MWLDNYLGCLGQSGNALLTTKRRTIFCTVQWPSLCPAYLMNPWLASPGLQVGLARATRLCQCRTAVITTRQELPMQVRVCLGGAACVFRGSLVLMSCHHLSP